MQHLPSLTDCKGISGPRGLQTYIKNLILSNLEKSK
jgi:hypothetical protein